MRIPGSSQASWSSVHKGKHENLPHTRWKEGKDRPLRSQRPLPGPWPLSTLSPPPHTHTHGNNKKEVPEIFRRVGGELPSPFVQMGKLRPDKQLPISHDPATGTTWAKT